MAWDRWSVVRIALGKIVPRVVLAWILIACGMNWLNRWLVYHPSREMLVTPGDYGMSYEDVTLVASDGAKLHAWYVPAEGAGGTVLFCHGNAGNVSNRAYTIGLIHKLGMNLLIFDYRGYGRSDGVPSEEGTYLDAEAAWRHLVEDRGEKPGRIVLHGRSLGGAVAAHLAGSRSPAGLIVESSFSDITSLGAELYPWLPVRWLSRVKYSTAEYVRDARCPVLVIHSPEDGMIDIRHGRTIFEAAEEPKRFVEIRGVHNSGYIDSFAVYDPALKAFFEDVVDDGNR